MVRQGSRGEKKLIFLPLGVVGSLTLFSGLILTAAPSLADAETDSKTVGATITVAPSCTLSGTVNKEHSATIVNGHYESEIGTTTLRTYCNDNNSYTLTAVGFTGNTEGNTNLVYAVDGATVATIPTGTAQNGNQSAWAMKLAKSGETFLADITEGYDDYHAVPAADTQVASYKAKANANPTDSKLTTTYAAYVSIGQTPGEYTGQVKYKMYQGAAPTVTPLEDGMYMQDVETEAIALESDGATFTLKDRRDDNTYTVAKINGNLWMTQNLRITASKGQSAGTILATDSNFSSNTSIAMTNGTSFNDYGTAQYYNSGDTSKGVWYSFCSAAAKQAGVHACDNSANYTGNEDICPAGWRLPTLTEFQGITSYVSGFKGVTGGNYNNGSLTNTGYGYWWSSTAYGNNYQYYLYYNGSSLSTSYSLKYYGFYVRCIRAS